MVTKSIDGPSPTAFTGVVQNKALFRKPFLGTATATLDITVCTGFQQFVSPACLRNMAQLPGRNSSSKSKHNNNRNSNDLRRRRS